MIEKSIVKVMLVIAWLLIVYKMNYSWIELSIKKYEKMSRIVCGIRN